jgi:hypothetical protein
MSRALDRVTFPAILFSLFIAGCGPRAAPALATQNELPPTTNPPSTALLPTSPATEMPPSLVVATTPPSEPTATYSPEIVATKPEEIAGIWLVKNFVGQGGMVRFPADLTFRQDGTFSFDEIDDPMHIFGGTLAFVGGQVTLDSEECYDEAKALFYHCTMTFTIFSTLQAGKPVRIRLESDRDTGVFIVNVKGKNLMLEEP